MAFLNLSIRSDAIAIHAIQMAAHRVTPASRHTLQVVGHQPPLPPPSWTARPWFLDHLQGFPSQRALLAGVPATRPQLRPCQGVGRKRKLEQKNLERAALPPTPAPPRIEETNRPGSQDLPTLCT